MNMAKTVNYWKTMMKTSLVLLLLMLDLKYCDAPPIREKTLQPCDMFWGQSNSTLELDNACELRSVETHHLCPGDNGSVSWEIALHGYLADELPPRNISIVRLKKKIFAGTKYVDPNRNDDDIKRWSANYHLFKKDGYGIIIMTLGITNFNHLRDISVRAHVELEIDGYIYKPTLESLLFEEKKSSECNQETSPGEGLIPSTNSTSTQDPVTNPETTESPEPSSSRGPITSSQDPKTNPEPTDSPEPTSSTRPINPTQEPKPITVQDLWNAVILIILNIWLAYLANIIFMKWSVICSWFKKIKDRLTSWWQSTLQLFWHRSGENMSEQHSRLVKVGMIEIVLLVSVLNTSFQS